MNLSQRKALDEKMRNGYEMTLQDSLDYFFLPEDQDRFAKTLGYEDAAQMVYYENMNMEVPPMTDREAEEFVEREEALAQEGVVGYIAPPPVELLALHECQKVDSREVYQEPLTDWQDLAGVY